jgi:hypothetical protein
MLTERGALYTTPMLVFEDYHRTIIGYHGTRLDVAQQIVSHQREFSPSNNDDDWLGHGIYFWEYAPQRAWSWATQRYKGDTVAVLGAMIRLGNCLDLLEPANAEHVRDYFRKMKREADVAGSKLPRNFNAKKRLDCAVFEYTASMFEEKGQAVDTIRGVYVPTSSKSRLWEKSGSTRRRTSSCASAILALSWGHGC